MKNIKKYIQSQKGTIPLIISVPHGGTVKIKGIPMRKHGIRGIDKATIRLGKDLVKNIEERYQAKKLDSKIPYYIFSKVHRTQIDFNRNPNKAYRDNSNIAQQIYSLYHETLKKYILESIEHFGQTTLIDIHGFESNKRPKGFRDVDIVLGTNNLKSIYSHERPKKRNWDNNIRGRIIETIQELGVPIAPSLSRRREYVLKGGYITQNYGASEFKKSQAIQIEFSERIRLDFQGNLRKNVLSRLTGLLVEEISDKWREN